MVVELVMRMVRWVAVDAELRLAVVAATLQVDWQQVAAIGRRHLVADSVAVVACQAAVVAARWVGLAAGVR